MELIYGKVRPLGRAEIIQSLKSSPSHCSRTGNSPYQEEMDLLLIQELLASSRIFPASLWGLSLSLSHQLLQSPKPAANPPFPGFFFSFLWDQPAHRGLHRDEIHPSHSHWDQVGTCRNHILGNQKLGNCSLPKPVAEDEHRDTGGKCSWAEFHGISNRRAPPEGHWDSGKGLGAPGHSLGNAAPAQFAPGNSFSSWGCRHRAEWEKPDLKEKSLLEKWENYEKRQLGAAARKRN